jgi:hypothetical protein
VQFVSVPDAGVPSTGVVSVGLVSVLLVSVSVVSRPTSVSVAAGRVTVTSAVEAGPLRRTRFEPLSVSSWKSSVDGPDAEACTQFVTSDVRSALNAWTSVPMTSPRVALCAVASASSRIARPAAVQVTSSMSPAPDVTRPRSLSVAVTF